MQSNAVQLLHHSQASVSLPVNPTSLYLGAREDLLLSLVCFPLFDTVVRVLMFPVEIYCYALRNKMRLLSGAPPAPRLPPGDP